MTYLDLIQNQSNFVAPNQLHQKGDDPPTCESAENPAHVVSRASKHQQACAVAVEKHADLKKMNIVIHKNKLRQCEFLQYQM